MIKNNKEKQSTQLKNISLNTLSGKQILDIIDYPYLKYYTRAKEMHRRFALLCSCKIITSNMLYKLNNIQIDAESLKYNGNYLVIINKENEYPDIEELSDYFNEECRVKCRFTGSVGSLYDNFRNNIDTIINHLHTTNRDITLQNLHEAVWETGAKTGYKNCSTFKPKIIKFFIEHFKAKRIIDISSGWGDRLIGAMASDILVYHGFDPNPCLHKNYEKIINFFSPVNKQASFVLKQLPFEKAILKPNYYDLVMSSPPYFDVEIYAQNDATQSTYNVNEREWYDNFLTVWIQKCYDALVTGGILALNINQMKYHHYVLWLFKDMKHNPKWEYLGVISYAYADLKNPQPTFIWKKI